MDLYNFFSAKSVAIVGASATPSKVGNVILKNLVDNSYTGTIFPVNPGESTILGLRCYSSLTSIKKKIDLVIIAIPAPYVFSILQDCVKKRVHHVVLISAGFSEIGNHALEKKLHSFAIKHNLLVIGPNCLGVYNGTLDTLFLPRYKLQRPPRGGLSFISQSGAVGSALMDIAAGTGIGFAKFASYGNALTVDESDLLEYLGRDKETTVICMYLEGAKDGKKFLDTASKVSKKKPILILKGGMSASGTKATMSHTGSLAGSAAVYKGVFRQSNCILSESPEDLFTTAQLLQHCPASIGTRVAIVTDGGGYGILCADALENHGFTIAQLTKKTKSALKKALPPLASVNNPIDLVGDATTRRYADALSILRNSPEIDIIICVTLFQVPRLSDDIIDILSEHSKGKKPFIVIAAGGDYTKVLSDRLRENNVAVFSSPLAVARAAQKFVEYFQRKLKT